MVNNRHFNIKNGIHIWNIFKINSQSIDFLVSSIRSTDKCSLQLPLLVLPELSHYPKTELVELIHGLLWILAAHELRISKCLSQTNLEQKFWNDSKQFSLHTKVFSGNLSLWCSMNFLLSSQWWLGSCGDLYLLMSQSWEWLMVNDHFLSFSVTTSTIFYDA